MPDVLLPMLAQASSTTSNPVAVSSFGPAPDYTGYAVLCAIAVPTVIVARLMIDLAPIRGLRRRYRLPESIPRIDPESVAPLRSRSLAPPALSASPTEPPAVDALTDAMPFLAMAVCAMGLGWCALAGLRREDSGIAVLFACGVGSLVALHAELARRPRRQAPGFSSPEITPAIEATACVRPRRRLSHRAPEPVDTGTVWAIVACTVTGAVLVSVAPFSLDMLACLSAEVRDPLAALALWVFCGMAVLFAATPWLDRFAQRILRT